ncbi:MAG: hypothetical protein OXE98_03520 [Hyphomicrobiales bacterium]|nr:hypothetical protein [Hyphomicrobiales bacterium]
MNDRRTHSQLIILSETKLPRIKKEVLKPPDSLADIWRAGADKYELFALSNIVLKLEASIRDNRAKPTTAPVVAILANEHKFYERFDELPPARIQLQSKWEAAFI